MYTSVVVARVGFAATRVGLAVEKFVPGVAEVSPARTWAGRFAEHIASVDVQFATTIARFSLAIVVVDLVVGSFALVVAWIAVAATKVALAITKVSFAVARVLE